METPDRAELLAAFRHRVDETIASRLAAERAKGEAMRAEVVRQLRDAVAAARGDGARGRVWLFGSFAWDLPTDTSDVDLLVDGDETAFVRPIAKVVARELHVVAAREAPPSLRSRVMREGMEL